jgi:hypothetical protein
VARNIDPCYAVDFVWDALERTDAHKAPVRWNILNMIYHGIREGVVLHGRNVEMLESLIGQVVCGRMDDESDAVSMMRATTIATWVNSCSLGT